MKKSFKKKLKVGDIIMAHRKGFHIVTDIEHRHFKENDLIPTGFKVGDERNSLIKYKTLYTSKYKKVNSNKIYSCDEEFCEVLDFKSIRSSIELELRNFNNMIEDIFKEGDQIWVKRQDIKEY